MPADNEHLQRIREQYLRSSGDSIPLFQVVLSVAEEIGLDPALGLLEQCVIQKRVAWLDKNLPRLTRTDNPFMDGYRLFYEEYLHVSIPEYGEIVEQTPSRLVTRWWNRCPTLEACQHFGLDTRRVCRRVYHQPVQVMLSRINPELVFVRNYAAIRPYTAYCEEGFVLGPLGS
jgi:hypothetical protein